jgi:hypothetical protein
MSSQVHDEVTTLQGLCSIYEKALQGLGRATAVALVKQGLSQAIFDILVKLCQKRGKASLAEPAEQALFAAIFQLLNQLSKYGLRH